MCIRDSLPTDPTTEIPPTEAAPIETVTATTPAAETTPEPAPGATSEPTVDPTSKPAIETDSLSLVFSTGFEAAAPELSVQGWLAVDVDGGKALQSGAEASTISYSTAYADSALRLRALLNDGTLSLALRQNAASGYTFSLSSDSTARLLRDGLEIASAQVALVPGEWITLEARAIGGTLSASVNSVVVLNYTDAAPLPLGGLSVASSAAALLRIDDLTILASGAGTPQSIPTTQPTETPTITQEATATKPADTPSDVPMVNAQTQPSQISYNFSREQDTSDWTLRNWAYEQQRGLLYAISDSLATLDGLVLSNASLSVAAQISNGAFRIYGRLSYSVDSDLPSAYVVEYSASGVSLLRDGILVSNISRQISPGRYVLGLEMLDGQINAYLNGEIALSYADSEPLPSGVLGLQFSAPQVLETGLSLYTIDDVTIRATSGSLPAEAFTTVSVTGVPEGQAVSRDAVTASPPSGPPPAGRGYLGDRVWHDLNRNGQQDAGEPGIPNVEVELWSGTQRLASGRTDANGLYWWSVTGGFNYYTVVVPPQGFIFTNPDIGNNNTDSDGQGNGSHPATFISIGEVDYSWDFGLIELTNICPGDTTLEIALVIDGSGSIGTTDFNKVRNFAAGLVDSFTIGNTATRFSIVQFSSTSSTIIELPLTGDRNTLINKIRTMRYQGGSTDITRGLNLGQSTLSRGRSLQQVPRALVLFTDGIHNGSGNPITEAQIIKNARTIIYAVGVGGFSLSQLNAISSDPDSRHVFTMNNFNELVNALQSIATNTCNTPVIPYIAPTLIDPANAARTNNNTPTFTWNVVPYASARYGGFYEITIADNPSLTNPLIRTNVTSPSYTLTTPLPQANPQDRTYYWRVVPGNSLGLGPSSAVRSFILDNTAPAAPNLSAPDDAAIVTSARPAFSWSAVSSGGTTSYRIQIDNNSNFGSPVINQVVSTTSFTPATPVHQGTNFWRVQAIDQAGNVGPWSAVRSFSVNSASTPIDEFFFISTNVGAVRFTWTSLSGASDIRLQISNSSNFASLLRNISVPTTSTAYTLSGSDVLPAGIYYWRLAVNVGFGLEVSPFFRKLTVTPPAPPVPTLITPDKLFTNDTTPTLDWNAVNYPYPGVTITYQVQISSSSTFSGCASGCQYKDLTVPSFTPTNVLADGLYYWRVKTSNMYGLESAWSAVRTFTVDTIAPAAPILTAPLGTIITLVRPAFSWSAVTGANRYHLDVSSNNFANLLPDYSNRLVTTASFTGSTSGTNLVAALPTGLYQWRVRALDAAGNQGPFSQTGVFYVATPLPPTPVITQLEGLASGAPFTNDQTPDASTTPVTPPALPNVVASYEFQISTTSTFTPATTLIVASADNLLDDADWAAAPVKQLPATPGQLYSVRMRLVYASTNPAFGVVYGPFSAVRTFTLDNTAPAAPTLNAPADNATATTLTPAFTWLAVPTATRYEIQLDTLNPPQRTFTVTTTSFTPPAPLLVNRVYQWRVRAFDAAGNLSPWSMQRSLNVATPTTGVPLLNSYATAQVPLAWGAVSWATAYEVQVDDSPAFTSPDFSFITPNGTQRSLMTSPLANGTYYWRVRARNAANVWGAWSAAASFIVDVP
jgi:hypothetical protein